MRGGHNERITFNFISSQVATNYLPEEEYCALPCFIIHAVRQLLYKHVYRDGIQETLSLIIKSTF